MEIKQFTWNIVDSNSWLITEEETVENHKQTEYICEQGQTGKPGQPVTQTVSQIIIHGLLIDAVDSQSLYEAITSLASLFVHLYVSSLPRKRLCLRNSKVLARI